MMAVLQGSSAKIWCDCAHEVLVANFAACPSPSVAQTQFISGNFDVLEQANAKKPAEMDDSMQSVAGVLTRVNDGEIGTVEWSTINTEGSFMVDDKCLSASGCYYEFCVHNGDEVVQWMLKNRAAESRKRKKERDREMEGGSMDDDASGVERDGYGDDMYQGAEEDIGQVRDRKLGFSLRVVGDNEEQRGSDGYEGEAEGGDESEIVIKGEEQGRRETEMSSQDKKLLKSLHSSSLTLLESLRTMEDHQSYMRQRESAHRDLAELTNSRVQFYTFVELFCLVVVSAGQILFLQRFFERKRRF